MGGGKGIFCTEKLVAVKNIQKNVIQNILRNLQLCLLHAQENAESEQSFINVLAKLVHFENIFDS